jgi:hypothetical protein
MTALLGGIHHVRYFERSIYLYLETSFGSDKVTGN